MSRELWKMNVIASCQKLKGEDLECVEYYIEHLEDLNKTLVDRINKAIEYIEEYKRLNWYEDSKHFYNVLDILKGSDKE